MLPESDADKIEAIFGRVMGGESLKALATEFNLSPSYTLDCLLYYARRQPWFDHDEFNKQKREPNVGRLSALRMIYRRKVTDRGEVSMDNLTVEELEQRLKALKSHNSKLEKAMIEAIQIAADIAKGDFDHEGYQEEFAIRICHILSEPLQP